MTMLALLIAKTTVMRPWRLPFAVFLSLALTVVGAGFGSSRPGSHSDAANVVTLQLSAPFSDARSSAAIGPGHITPFIMLSGYHLEPYDRYYLVNALAELGRTKISGIVYGTLGDTDRFLSKTQSWRDAKRGERDHLPSGAKGRCFDLVAA